MVQLLGKPYVYTLPVIKPTFSDPETHERRQLMDRRRTLPSLAEVARWYAAIALKLGSVLFLAALASWWLKAFERPQSFGVSGGKAVYQWQGYHRVNV